MLTQGHTAGNCGPCLVGIEHLTLAWGEGVRAWGEGVRAWGEGQGRVRGEPYAVPPDVMLIKRVQSRYWPETPGPVRGQARVRSKVLWLRPNPHQNRGQPTSGPGPTHIRAGFKPRCV